METRLVFMKTFALKKKILSIFVQTYQTSDSFGNLIELKSKWLKFFKNKEINKIHIMCLFFFVAIQIIKQKDKLKKL